MRLSYITHYHNNFEYFFFRREFLVIFTQFENDRQHRLAESIERNMESL